jgi:hypothetical protein
MLIAVPYSPTLYATATHRPTASGFGAAAKPPKLYHNLLYPGKLWVSVSRSKECRKGNQPALISVILMHG